MSRDNGTEAKGAVDASEKKHNWLMRKLAALNERMAIRDGVGLVNEGAHAFFLSLFAKVKMEKMLQDFPVHLALFPAVVVLTGIEVVFKWSDFAAAKIREIKAPADEKQKRREHTIGSFLMATAATTGLVLAIGATVISFLALGLAIPFLSPVLFVGGIIIQGAVQLGLALYKLGMAMSIKPVSALELKPVKEELETTKNSILEINNRIQVIKQHLESYRHDLAMLEYKEANGLILDPAGAARLAEYRQQQNELNGLENSLPSLHEKSTRLEKTVTDTFKRQNYLDEAEGHFRTACAMFALAAVIAGLMIVVAPFAGPVLAMVGVGLIAVLGGMRIAQIVSRRREAKKAAAAEAEVKAAQEHVGAQNSDTHSQASENGPVQDAVVNNGVAADHTIAAVDGVTDDDFVLVRGRSSEAISTLTLLAGSQLWQQDVPARSKSASPSGPEDIGVHSGSPFQPAARRSASP